MEAQETLPHEMQPINPNWEANIDNQANVTFDDLKFIFAQAEKRLDDGIKNYDATTSKSISFITLSATLLTALAAYFFVNFDPKGTFDSKLCTVMICCVYTAFFLYRFVYIVLPKAYQPIGSYPQDLYTEHNFKMGSKVKGSELSNTTMELYLGELENYNRRIAENIDTNSERLRIFNQSAKAIIFMPVVGAAVYSVLVLGSLF